MSTLSWGVGVHYGMDFLAYQCIPHLNASTLVWADVSMQHLKAAIDGRLVRKDTPALALGRAIHVKLMEPHAFDEQYKVASPCAAILKSGRRRGSLCGCNASYLSESSGEWFCGSHMDGDCYEPENMISSEDAAMIDALCQSVIEHDVIHLLRSHGGVEATTIAELDGVMMKTRQDKYIPQGTCPATIIDIKTVEVGGGTDVEFSRAIERYSYDQKAAIYCDAIHAVEGVMPKFIWVVVEKGVPYSVNVIMADRDTIAIGRHRYRSSLAKYKACLASGVWPGYASDIHLGGHGKYVRSQYRGVIDQD